MNDQDNAKWFYEDTVPGQRYGHVRHGFFMDQLVYEGKSAWQNILIFDHSVYGRMLVLDDIVQLSKSDEYIYHEMLTHPLLLSHPNPQRILIIGGGDGGTARECLKHNPAELIMVDIDREVIDIAREHLPFTAKSFDDERLQLIIGDGTEVIQQYPDYFDCIIVDCNDAVGPSMALFEEAFYRALAQALKADGVASFQAGSFLDLDFLSTTAKTLRPFFNFQSSLRLTLPSYHCGEYCFLMASKTLDLKSVSINDLQSKLSRIEGYEALRYYSPAMHHYAQLLPAEYQVLNENMSR